jgi:hypothetical protein
MQLPIQTPVHSQAITWPYVLCWFNMLSHVPYTSNNLFQFRSSIVVSYHENECEYFNQNWFTLRLNLLSKCANRALITDLLAILGLTMEQDLLQIRTGNLLCRGKGCNLHCCGRATRSSKAAWGTISRSSPWTWPPSLNLTTYLLRYWWSTCVLHTLLLSTTPDINTRDKVRSPTEISIWIVWNIHFVILRARNSVAQYVGTNFWED